MPCASAVEAKTCAFRAFVARPAVEAFDERVLDRRLAARMNSSLTSCAYAHASIARLTNPRRLDLELRELRSALPKRCPRVLRSGSIAALNNFRTILCRTRCNYAMRAELSARRIREPNTRVTLLTGGLLVRIQPEELVLPKLNDPGEAGCCAF